MNNDNNFNNNIEQPVVQPEPVIQPQPVVQPEPMPQPAVQPAAPAPEKKGNGGLIIVIIIVALLLIGGGVFAYFKLFNKQDNNKIVNNDNGQKDIIEPIENENTETNGDYTIAVLGQEGHGKTELMSAITKYFNNYKTVEELSMAPEIDKYAVSFNASIINYKLNDKSYIQYDFPRHSDMLKALISGFIKFDGAIIVISAPDGPMPQTKESIYLLQQLGVSNVVVYLNNCDQVEDSALLEILEMEIRELLGEYDFDNVPIVRGSADEAIKGNEKYLSSIKELMNEIDKTITKKGPRTKYYYKRFGAEVYFLTKEEKGMDHALLDYDDPMYGPDYPRPQIRINNGAYSVNGRIYLQLGTSMIIPGDNSNITIELDKMIKMTMGDQITIMDSNKVIGYGTVVNLYA